MTATQRLIDTARRRAAIYRARGYCFAAANLEREARRLEAERERWAA